MMDTATLVDRWLSRRVACRSDGYQGRVHLVAGPATAFRAASLLYRSLRESGVVQVRAFVPRRDNTVLYVLDLVQPTRLREALLGLPFVAEAHPSADEGPPTITLRLREAEQGAPPPSLQLAA